LTNKDLLGFPGGSEVKEFALNAGDPGSIPESGRFPWRRLDKRLTKFFVKIVTILGSMLHSVSGITASFFHHGTKAAIDSE